MHNIRKHITVLFLCACLLLLTGMNFFVYAVGDGAMVVMMENECWDEDAPQAPIEEKAPETTSSTIIEEFLHNDDHLSIDGYNQLTLHRLHAAERLQIIHYELVSPPPEQLS